MTYQRFCALVTLGLVLCACDSGDATSGNEQSAAIISGDDTATLIDSSTTEVEGTLSITDEQADEAYFQTQTDVTDAFGIFNLSRSGEWRYELIEDSESLKSLTASDEQVVDISVFSADSTSHTISLTIVGIDDPAVITILQPNAINADTDEVISGTIGVVDLDDGQGSVEEQTIISTDYGTFSITSAGIWSYSLTTTHSAVAALTENETLTDSITILTDDGSTAQLMITIVGTAHNASNFEALITTQVSSDGPNNGSDAYSLIEAKFGSGSIESPDLYEGNHQEVIHIIEETDDVVGNHFVFLMHLNEDHDRDKGETDRQRNEIKTFDSSNPNTLAFENETFQYSWKFKVSSELELSSKFSHFFQLKAKNQTDDYSNGDDSQPIITLSGAEKPSTGNQLQVRYSAGKTEDGDLLKPDEDKNIIEEDWSLITDEWVEVFVQATFAEQGVLTMTMTRISDGLEIFNIYEENIDMWRGVGEEDFVRPKWGIYRSTDNSESLREDEEQIRFQDFTIIKGQLTE